MRKSLIVVLLFSSFLGAFAQTMPETQSIQSTANSYLGAELTLRHFYRGKKIEYDIEGAPMSKVKQGYWKTDGIVEIRRVEVKPAYVELHAVRRELLMLDSSYSGLAYHVGEPQVILRIATEGGDAGRLKRALDQVFVVREEALLSEVNPNEKKLADIWWRINHAKPSTAMIPPKVLHRASPEYQERGTIVLKVLIQTDGRARVTEVVRGLSKKANESAKRAIEKWQFLPARKDGMPIETTVNVEVIY